MLFRSVGNGGVAPFEGDLDDYRRLILSGGGDDNDGRGEKSADKASRADQRRAAAEKRAELAPLKRRITAIEKDMTKATRRIAEIDAILADHALYTRDPSRATALAKERSDAAAALGAAEEQWLTLSGEYEDATAE